MGPLAEEVQGAKFGHTGPDDVAEGANQDGSEDCGAECRYGFRTNLIKSTLQVDTRPSYPSIDTYYKHLMAECEALAVASSALTVQVVNTTPVKPEPKIKPMRTNRNNNAPQPPKPPPTSPTSGANEQQMLRGVQGTRRRSHASSLARLTEDVQGPQSVPVFTRGMVWKKRSRQGA